VFSVLTEPYSERKKGNVNDMEEFLKSTHLPLEQIRCPSLIIHGTHDADVKFFDGVYEHIPGAERYWIEEGDHTGFWLDIGKTQKHVKKEPSLCLPPRFAET
jgi:pimeloyl-ACP methyl ester carboxylesterase